MMLRQTGRTTLRAAAMAGAAAICMMAGGCKEKDYFDKTVYDEIIEAAFPVTAIDPLHMWTTVRSVRAYVGVSWMHDGSYRVDIYRGNPQGPGPVTLMCSGTVDNGGTMTGAFSGGYDDDIYHVALTDPDGHRTVKTARAPGGVLECSFNGTAEGGAAEGDGIITVQRPDVETLAEGATEAAGGAIAAGSGVTRLVVSGQCGEWLPTLEEGGVSVYVTGTWMLPRNQTIGPGSMVVVARGGRLTIPSGMTLATATGGHLCVTEGGNVDGAGTLSLAATEVTAAQDGGIWSAYNGGTVQAGRIDLTAGGLLYNAGGGSLAAQVLTGQAARGGRMVNRGTATLGEAGSGSDGVSVHNAGRLEVNGRLAMGGDSRMGQGAYAACATLALAGRNAAGSRLTMGADAYLNCRGQMDIDHCGIAGPQAGGYAMVAFTGAGEPQYAEGVLTDHIVNNVCLIYPQGSDAGSTLFNIYNGNGGSLALTEAERGVVMATSAPYSREAGALSPGFVSRPDAAVETQPGGLTFCFEDNFPQEGDYDFNDIVLTVEPVVSGSTVTVGVTLQAVGSLKQLAAAVRICGVSRDDVTAVERTGDFDSDTGKPSSSYQVINSREPLLPAGMSLTGDLVLNLFSDAHWALAPVTETNGSVRRYYYNTVAATAGARPDRADVSPVTVTYRLTMSSPEAAAKFTADNIDAFIIESFNGTFVEVHTAPFKTAQVIYRYIKDPADYEGGAVWALCVPAPFRYPLEGVTMGSNRNGVLSGAYQMPGHSFPEWVLDRTSATDWYAWPNDRLVY